MGVTIDQLASVFIVSDDPVYGALATPYKVRDFFNSMVFLVPGHDQQAQVDADGHHKRQQRDQGKVTPDPIVNIGKQVFAV